MTREDKPSREKASLSPPLVLLFTIPVLVKILFTCYFSALQRYTRWVTTADVIVVGGGIIGCACAFRLSERGFKVAVLEANSGLGQGSTGRSGAGVRVQFSEEVNVRLSWESIQEYRTFRERYGADSGYTPVGYLFLVAEKDWAEHEQGIAAQRRVGVPLSELTPNEAQALVPLSLLPKMTSTAAPTAPPTATSTHWQS